ncbi:hypothetical protein E2C01_060072 [Portunus trituberculatus]|uniref:Uncharacterized protein n=1 Tax=Portunus trituberculatus TaxID=210409 RepID=A0A5B7HB13_PORTR|nr:hypothetical protein [Portunus trituberculatus]
MAQTGQKLLLKLTIDSGNACRDSSHSVYRAWFDVRGPNKIMLASLCTSSRWSLRVAIKRKEKMEGQVSQDRMKRRKQFSSHPLGTTAEKRLRNPELDHLLAGPGTHGDDFEWDVISA